jgi:phosphoribosyl 1,2-cyclic phosphodiesterase
VLHGGSYISLGFSIGAAGNEFVYISDVKVIPPDTMAYLKSLPRIKTLVLDSLKWDTDNFGHASLREVLPWVDELQPERVFLVGAGCGWGDHDKANEDLATKRGYPHVQLAFDGMFLEGFKLYD